MKKLLSFLLAVLLIVSVATPASAETSEALTGTCGDTITWRLENGTLTLSGTGTLTVGIEPPSFDQYWKQIRHLVVEEGITGLDRCSFLSYTELLTVALPDSLTSIGSQAFQGCDKLKTIRIPKNVTSIGDIQGSPATTFSGDLLESIEVDPENPRYYAIDGVLFDRCANALLCYPMGKREAAYRVPDGIQELTYGAFWFFEGELTLPQGLQVIDDSAFYAAKFTALELPDSLRSIGSMAFTNCDRLTAITIPASVEKIGSQAFASCEMLEQITILNPNCELSSSGDTLSSNSRIRGYLNSTAQTYAINYGRNFVDIESDQLYPYDNGNAAYISLLPTQVGGTAPAYNIWSMVDGNTGEVTGFQPELAVELDKTNPTYQEMLAFVTDLTKNCTNDYTRARAVSEWVNENMTYVFGMMGCGTTAEGIYKIWEHRQGNCMGYTQLTNFLLYLLDIPTASITSYAHAWSAALIDGRWIMIDSTNGIFDAPPDSFEDIQTIFFAVDDNLVCVINDLTGVKLASYGISIYDHQLVSEITIPDYIVYIYESVFFLEDCYQTATTHLTIHGTAGSYAETYLRQNLPHYNSYTYENGMFTAKVGKVWTEEDAIALLKHVLFPELYAIEGDMDFTDDGQITEADAVYLLRHILFPEIYPL